MEVKKIPNNQKNNQDGNQTTGKTGSAPGKKKGRPKGATDKQERKKRTDRSVAMDPNENSNMIKYAMALMNLPKIDYNNLEQLKQRIQDYFDLSAAYGYKPAVASLASSLSVDRVTLFNWLNGKTETIKNRECFNTLKAAYDSINMLYEIYMNTGKINPVAGIFLMKNNMGYKDTTDYIITANQEQQVTLPDLVNRAGLLSE